MNINKTITPVLDVNLLPLPPVPLPPVAHADTKVDITHKLLLIASVASAAISLIPPLRLMGSILLRSVALINSSLDCTNRWTGMTSHLEKALKCLKIVIITGGLIAVAASVPFLMVASIAADIALNLFEAIKAFHHGDMKKGFVHLVIVVIDSLALSAILAGSWQLMVAAASISAAAMGAAAIASIVHAKKPTDAIDIICYIALMVIGTATAMTTREVSLPARVIFHARNNTNSPLYFFNRHGELLRVAQPGEYVVLDVPTLDTRRGLLFSADRFIYCQEDMDPNTSRTWFENVGDNWDAGSIITQEALDPKFFPTLPVGGTTLSTQIVS